jgi:hypothetical protein
MNVKMERSVNVEIALSTDEFTQWFTMMVPFLRKTSGAHFIFINSRFDLCELAILTSSIHVFYIRNLRIYDFNITNSLFHLHELNISSSRSWSREFTKLKPWIQEVQIVKFKSWIHEGKFMKLKLWTGDVEIVNSWS